MRQQGLVLVGGSLMVVNVVRVLLLVVVF